MKGYFQVARQSHSDFVFLLEIFQGHFFSMCYPYIYLDTMPWIG